VAIVASEAPSRCATVVIEDVPAEQDGFASPGETGPHARVASAIADVIKSGQAGGKVIALEGGWGSGKTTIVNLVRKELQEQDHVHLFPFDAWAHEGDPLRRTYLETLIRSLIAKKWINESSWSKSLLELAQRQKTTTTTASQRPSSMALFAGGAALLVPLGLALLSKSLDDLTFAFRYPPEWKFIVGLPLSLGPLLVVLGFWIRHKWTHREGRFTWAFTESHADTETKSETSETPDPTSIEFEDRFNRLMVEALPEEPKRSLVIVLDNLDRVKVEDALKIWATLQTFIQHRPQPPESWFKKVSILVPYDADGLRRLWSKETGKDDTASFMDKSFQMRFDVPSMLLSNWKVQLLRLLHRALPDHLAADYEAIYRIFAASITTDAPTPRELVLYVNQIGVIHRQWQDEFPISHVAFYAAERRKLSLTAIQTGLESGQLVAGRIKTILPDSNILENVTGLLFNVRASLGMQLLLFGPIRTALTSGDDKKLSELESVHKAGFWAVLEKVVIEELSVMEQAGIAKAAVALEASGVLNSDRSESESVKRRVIETVAGFESWSPLDNITFRAVALTCELAAREEVSDKLVGSVRNTVRESAQFSGSSEELVEALEHLGEQVIALGHAEAVNQPFLVAFEPAEWVAVCPRIIRFDKRWWSLMKPTRSLDEINGELGRMIEAGDFGPDQLSVVRLVRSSFSVRSWKALMESIGVRLQAQVVKKSEVEFLLRCLALIRFDEKSEVDKLLQVSVDQGHLLNLLDVLSSISDGRSSAWCFFVYMKIRPDAPPPPAYLRAQQGYQRIAPILKSEDESWVNFVLELVDIWRDGGWPWRIIEAKGFEPLPTACLKAMVDRDQGHKAITVAAFLRNWRLVEENVDDDSKRFLKLISTLCSESQLTDVLQSEGFDPTESVLYAKIANAYESSSFEEWLRRGLDSIEKDAWKAELAKEGDALQLAISLGAKGYRLKASFDDALIDIAKKVATGADQPIERTTELVTLLEPSLRRVFPERVYLEVIPQDGNCSDEFFRMLGDSISDERIVRKQAAIFVRLLSPLVRERRVVGLKWFVKLLKKRPQFLGDMDADGVESFKERLREELDKDTDPGDEFHEQVVQTCALLGIERTPPNPPEEQTKEG
jgi:hypothetical protein